MPLKCKQKEGKWICTDPEGKVHGTHDSETACKKQIAAIEANKHSKLKNEGDALRLYGPISDSESFAKALSEREGVHLRINSRGGSVVEALGIFNAIDKHPHPVDKTIDGAAMSSASWIALAGKGKTRMAENGIMMMHNPQLSVKGDINEMQKKSGLLKTATDSIVNTYVKKTGIEEEKIREMMDKETYLSAQEAKEKGFIDEIIEIENVVPDVVNIDSIPERFRESFKRSSKDEDSTMELKDFANELEVDISNQSDDDAKNSILDVIRELKKRPQPVDKKKPSEAVVNMAQKLRNMEIDQLVNEFRVTKAVGDDLKKLFSSSDHLSDNLTNAGDAEDNFVELMNVLKNLEPTLESKKKNTKDLDKKEPEDQDEGFLVNLLEKQLEGAN